MPEVIFTGPAGRLEGRFHQSAQRGAPIAIVLHPHPQFGGTMNNQIVYHLYYAFAERGFSVLRFNFRGVGRSQGAFDHGAGELVGRRRGAGLGAGGQSGSARLLDRRRLLRLLDRHAIADAPARDRGLRLHRAAGQSLRFFLPGAVPVLRACSFTAISTASRR